MAKTGAVGGHRHLKVTPEPGDPEGPEFDQKAKARVSLRPTVQGAITLREVNQRALGELDLSELVDALADQAKAVQDGDLRRAEGMLMTHASTLDALFNRLVLQAVPNIGHYPDTVALYMKLALKAQAQARATIATLAEMKNPRPVAFVAQANVGQNVQVNNGAPNEGTRAADTQNPPTELLGASDGERLDTGTTSASGRGDPTLATVDPIHGTANG